VSWPEICSDLEPGTENVPPEEPSVTERLVLVCSPLRARVPPLSTRLEAAVPEEPSELGAPPSPRLSTARVPPWIRVGPL